MRRFRDYYENKIRQSVKQLNTVKQILEKAGFKIDNYLDEQFQDDPYIYVHNPNQDTSFEGIRMYKIGDKIAYRIARESKTHPYGEAYALELELMFDDLMEDGIKPEKIGEKVIDLVVKEIRNFFEESAEAEKERENQIDKERDAALGMVHIRNPLGGDYSSLTHEMDKR